MDEQAQLSGLRQGDAAAVRSLLDAYGPRLLRSACLLCGDATEAQDLVQETFLQAIRSCGRFRGESSLYTWLYSILLNVVRHYHRKRRRLVCDDALARQEAIAPHPEAAQAIDQAVASSAIREALQTLSLPHREVILLRFFEGRRIEEIAAQLGLASGTVKSRLHYAISQLQRALPREMNLFATTGTDR